MRYKFYFFVCNYNIEMQSILDRLKVKPKAKKIDLITVKINPEKKEDVAVNVSIVDKRKEITINRNEILKTINQRNIPESSIKKQESQTKLDTETKKKSKKIGKISLRDDKIETKSTTTRITEKPDTKVVFEGTPAEIVIGTNIDKERLPTKKEKVILSSSSYYMNNRQKFTSFINNHFKPYKEQFKLLKTTQSCGSNNTGEFKLLLHQKLVRDYLNFYTPYRGLLLFHGLGSGKTCTSIAIAEGLKTSQNVLIMTPASLRRNYIEELKFCGDSIFKKNQFWEFIKADKEEIIQELAAVLSINVDHIRKNNGAWLVNVKKESNYDSLSPEDQHSLDLQINEMIRNKYQFINYNGLRESHLKQYTLDYTINPFDNKVIIIDEAHNFVSRISNKLKRPESIAMRLYNYLMNAENCRLVLLTGTPIINYPNELGILFNMLRGFIKSWSLRLNIKTREKINQESIKKILYKSKALASILDFIEYKSSSKTLVVAKNPMGFVNRKYRDEYKGVFKNDERGNISDENFLKFISKILHENDIDVVESGIKLATNKCLPDDKDSFINYFVDDNNKVKNENLFQKRIIGLTSYYGDIKELMPEFNKKTDLKHIYLEMSDYQFAVYESARIQERKQERNNKKKAKKDNDVYEDTSSTYRIFSRAFCNFVFPKTISRPFPKEGDTIESASAEANNKNEELLDGNNVESRLNNVDGEYAPDDVEQLKQDLVEISDSSYESRIKKALEQLKEDGESIFSKESLKTYSPKFLNILENIQDESHRGLHLVYSQFRTLEGIGILKLVLEHHGFVQFKLKKTGNGETKLDINDEDKGKQMFGLYTGTETDDEKELIRKVYNSDWDNIPLSLKEDLESISTNNFNGEIMKVILITASGAEGISLKNCRYVHITEPYWHPVRIDQVIGRARRICSHENLEPELRNVQVFLYIMKLSKELIDSDKTLELRLHDKSKLDGKTPITTDEALDETALIKEEISKNLLKAVKQSAIDCSVYQQKEGDEPLVCYSFGNVDEKKYSYYPSLEEESEDKVAVQNDERIKWVAKEVKMKGIKYAMHPDTKEMYDLDDYKLAVETGAKMNALGKLEEQSNGKIKFVKYS